VPELLDDPSNQQEIQQILDQVYPVLNDPSSNYYLPTFIRNNKYDPYDVSSPWTWNLNDPTTLSTAGTVCNDIANNDNTWPCTVATNAYILDPSIMPVLKLTNVVLSGFSNAVSERPVCQSDGVTIIQKVDFSTLGAPQPPQVTVTGSFELDLNCCCSTDHKTCLPSTSSPYVGTGTFLATIPSSSVTITYSITDLAPNVLTITVSSVQLAVPNGSNGLPNIQITVKIVSAGDIPAFNNLANEAFNSQTGLDAVLSNTETFLNTTAALQLFGNIVTQEVDGYLQANHDYPFNNASLSII